MAINRREYLKGTAAIALGSMMSHQPAAAQSRAETLRQVLGSSFTSLDPTMQGGTREGAPLSMNIYDRLASFEKKSTPGGMTFDMDNIRGELAHRIDRSSDGLSFTFHIREGATWHDGTPVEIADVKWSLDRSVSAQSLAKAQTANGSMTDTEQFKVVGDRQIEIKLAKPDRLALATLCVPSVFMINSKLAKRYATADDPWASNWLKENTAAGGAYMVESNRPGQQIVLKRNDNWKNGKDGKLPYFRRVIAQTVPDVSARASLVERGDADMTLDAATSDIVGIEQRGKARVIPVPQNNAIHQIALNTQLAPFNDLRVRRAISMAIPYEALFKAALFERGKPLYGSTWTKPTEPLIFQPVPNHTDIAKAKAMLAEAGFASGFKTTFSFATSAASLCEPMASLIQESLGKVGVEVAVQKLPESQFVQLMSERRLPMFFDYETSWFPAAEYVIRTFFSGPQRWNASAWNDADVIRLAEEARFETNQQVYNEKVIRIVKRIADEVPVCLLWQPGHDAVIGRDIQGYTYWFHRGADYRDLTRA